jgi:adenylyltransferase/sulfurtransferase
VLGVLPGIIGTLQALEVLKLILGVGEPLIGRLVMFDALGFSFRELALRRDPDCAVCGTAPRIRAPVDCDAFCGVAAAPAGTPELPALTVQELNSRRAAGETFDLLDVREPHEFEIVRIPGARLLPLSELPSRLHELDSTRTYTLSCHRGTRSVQAYHLLRGAGFTRLQVLSGGVDAWAASIDPSLPRY